MQKFVFAALRGDWVESWWFIGPAVIATWGFAVWRASEVMP